MLPMEGLSGPLMTRSSSYSRTVPLSSRRLLLSRLLGLERLGLDAGNAVGWKVWAWAKLMNTWASLRWPDLQVIIPARCR